MSDIRSSRFPSKLVLAFGAVGALGIAPVRAQNVSDLNPPAPAAPSGGGPSYWLPGMPAPAVGGNTASNPTTSTGAIRSDAGKVEPRHGEAVLDPEDVEGGTIQVDNPHAVEGDTGQVPDTHIVRKGETLWDISANYFHSPWQWPKLWSYNPLVTNPHWIYPGDVLRLSPQGQELPVMAAMPMATATESAPAGMKVVTRTWPTNLTLRQNGFVEPGELNSSGKIIGSREERDMLTHLDEAYVQYSADQPLKAGERYTIYRVVNDVKHPHSKAIVGSIIEIVGEVEVRSLNPGRIAKVVISEALNPIERGYRVGPLRHEYKIVEPRPDQTSVDGVVVSTLRPAELVGEAMLVFIDRGREDGLENGNRMVVVQRGDGRQPLLTDAPPDDARYPREVLGEVLLIDVRNRVSTGIVMRSIKEVRVGAKVEARKGY